jgi:cholesterol transport system auxiliary component
MNRLSRRVFVLAVCCVALAACTPFSSSKSELAVYGLTLSARAQPGAAVTWQLLIDEPVADDTHSGARIVLRPSAGAYGVYAGARWTNRAPELVQAALVQGFEDSGRILGVGRTSDNVRGDFALISELREFNIQIDEAGGARARIALSAKLVRYTTSEVVAAHVFDASDDTGTRDVDAAAAAMQRAMNTLVPAVMDWAFEVGEANWQASQPRAR